MSAARPDVASFSLSGRKITEFLLVPGHVDNKGRAKFFTDRGFAIDAPEVLARALLHQPRTAPAFAYQRGRLGQVRLAYDGPLRTPDGRGAHVRTIWNFDDAPAARFITVFPLPRSRRGAAG